MVTNLQFSNSESVFNKIIQRVTKQPGTDRK